MQGCADLDPDCEWTIDYQVGQSTATEQITAVENFITAGYDAIVVIQNSVDATSECIAKCKDAGIPYFGAGHNFVTAPNCHDAAGSCCYDFVQAGKYSGEDAAARGVTKIVNIQGVLGQGSAAAQTQGLLEGLKESGKNLGAEIEDIMMNESNAKYDGTQDVQIVFWAAGNWAADPAQKAMTDAITSLGADGFDAVYVQNNPMCEGVIAAMQDAGLNPSDYLITSCNGREMSWQWAKDGVVAQDVNQPASMEGNVLYQQIKAWSLGQDYRKYIHPYLTSYTKDDINELEPSLVPVTDVDAFLKGVEEGAFVTDINDPKFVDNAGY
jgi:ABC-type sugar transport system substrate-binding protein